MTDHLEKVKSIRDRYATRADALNFGSDEWARCAHIAVLVDATIASHDVLSDEDVTSLVNSLVGVAHRTMRNATADRNLYRLGEAQPDSTLSALGRASREANRVGVAFETASVLLEAARELAALVR